MAQIDDFAKAERLAYYKKWRSANPERIKKHNENYWRKRVERKLLEQQNTDKDGAKDADINSE